MNETINNILDQPGIKCFILSNSECRSCAEWFDNFYEPMKQNFNNIEFHVIDCYEEQQKGNMPFPPLVAPTFYFYKDKTEFPIISQGMLPEPELSQQIERIIKVIEND